jgi:hypothetical protein
MEYILVIFLSWGGATSVTFPSKDECEAARNELIQDLRMPSGSALIPHHAVCLKRTTQRA